MMLVTFRFTLHLYGCWICSHMLTLDLHICMLSITCHFHLCKIICLCTLEFTEFLSISGIQFWILALLVAGWLSLCRLFTCPRMGASFGSSLLLIQSLHQFLRIASPIYIQWLFVFFSLSILSYLVLVSLWSLV